MHNIITNTIIVALFTPNMLKMVYILVRYIQKGLEWIMLLIVVCLLSKNIGD